MTDLSKIKAEVGHYSSVVGNSVHLMLDGHMIGQLAILCHTDDLRGKEIQTALCERIVQGFNLDALLAAAVMEGMGLVKEAMPNDIDVCRTLESSKEWKFTGLARAVVATLPSLDKFDETAIDEAVKRIKTPDR